MFKQIATFALTIALAAPSMLLAATPVNINTADAHTIAKSLDGIGQTRAKAIVAWREANGPFKKADNLTRVKGVGKATVERNRSAILLGDNPSEKHAPAGDTKAASTAASDAG